MPSDPSGQGKRRGKRVDFRQNRLRPARRKQWTLPDDHDPEAEDAATWESVRAKGELSRKRTVIDKSEETGLEARRLRGRAIAVRGAFVEVLDGDRLWLCTVRRVLRTRLIRERAPVVVGDEVTFRIVAEEVDGRTEGVIEEVHPRRTALYRADRRRTQILAANLDQALIVSSIREPRIKPHLIDRYLVAAHAGGLDAIICINKVDLDEEGRAAEVVERYAKLGYRALATSVPRGDHIEVLKGMVRDRVTIITGQSGVGKSSLLNAIQPGLNLKTAHVSTITEKGRHTTTTAVWYLLDGGGAIIDTPGIRALDVAMVPLNELEAHFVEFVDRVAGCKFANCIHIHETGCAIQAAVEAGEIDPARYQSYVQLFTERSQA